MAEELVVEGQAQVAPTQEELAAFAFQDQLPKPAAPPIAAAPLPAEAAPPAEEYEIVDPQELGFTSWADLKSSFMELKTKAETPAVFDPKYENEASKRVAEYLLKGDEEQVYKTLHARQQIKGVDTMGEEQKLKLFIRLQNPLYTDKLIDAVYNRDYTFNEAKFKDENGNITDQIAYELAQVDAKQKIIADTAKANEFFESYKTKINLSPIQPAGLNDPEFDAFKAAKAQQAQVQDRVQNVIIPAINSVTETDIPLGFSVNDPNNQMQFDVALAIEKADLDEAKQEGVDFDGWIRRTFYDDKGNFQQAKLIRAIAMEKHAGKYFQSAVRQAVNAERRRMVGKDAPIIPIEKNFDTTENDQLKQLEKAAFGTFGIK